MTSKELQNIKANRLTEPEKIILESFKGLHEYVCDDDPDWIFYKSDKGVLYAYNEKTGRLEYNYDLYKKVYLYFFGNFIKMNDFIQIMVKKHLKLNVVTSNRDILHNMSKIGKQFKLKL